MTKFNIREVAPSDYEKLPLLLDEGDALHRDNLPWMFQKSADGIRTQQEILDRITDEAIGFFVAHSDEQLIGALWVILKESPDIPIFVPRRYAVVDNVIVHKASQRMGVGRALMAQAHEWAIAKGVASIELNVWEFNQTAIDFYKTLGYETVSRKMSKRLR